MNELVEDKRVRYDNLDSWFDLDVRVALRLPEHDVL